jgi:glycosyltransferase involved in cell wall biosynthesis
MIAAGEMVAKGRGSVSFLETFPPLRVLHCAETLIGGPASYLNAIIPDQIAHYGRDGVCIVAPSAHLKYLTHPELCMVYERSGRNWRSLRALAAAIEAAIGTYQPHIIHAHSFFSGLALRALMERPRAGVIYCPHGWAFCRRNSWIARSASLAIEVALQGRADIIQCISQFEHHAAARAGIAADRLLCLPNRIPDLAPAGGPPERVYFSDALLRVAFLGRLDRQKGVDILFDAARMLQGQIEVVVAGAAVVSPAVLHNMPPNVRRVGWLAPDQSTQLLREADVLVVPSRWEGFGLVVLEAMRAGTAVIASRVDGLPELVDDGVTGQLIPPNRSDILATALQRLTRTSAAQMGAAGRQKFEQFFPFADYTAALRWRYAALALGSMRAAAPVAPRAQFGVEVPGADIRHDQLAASNQGGNQ